MSKITLSDEELVALIKKGEEAYYRQLVDKYKNYAFTLALRIAGNRQEAEEIAQDAFVKAYNHISSFQGGSKFSTWLYRIVYNTAVSKGRKKRLQEVAIESAAEVELGDAGVAGEELFLQERKQWVTRAIAALPPDEAFLITLYYFRELTLDEMEQVTGLSPNVLKVRIFRVRKKLAKWLEKHLKKEIDVL